MYDIKMSLKHSCQHLRLPIIRNYLCCGFTGTIIFTVLLAALSILTPFFTYGQIVSFNHISQEHGLRNGNIRAMVKDYQGFMWIGTEDGLHRYDGYTMRIYRSDENDSLSLSSNFILCMFEDSEKNLWIGTLDGSLCVYDRKHDNFRRFQKQLSGNDTRINDAIRVFYEDKTRHLYVGSGQLSRAVVSSNLDSIKFENIPLPIDAKDMNWALRIMEIVENPDGGLLIGVNNIGLLILDTNTDKFTRHPISDVEKNIQAIEVDNKRNLLWVGTWKNGLLLYDFKNHSQKWIKKGDDEHSIRNNFVPALAADSAGNIWIGADHGLSLVTTETIDTGDFPVIKTFLPQSQNASGIPGSIIKSLYVDDHDNLWVGMYYDGVAVYKKRSMNFGSIVLPSEESDNTMIANISSILSAEQLNGYWIGVDGGGLYFMKDKIGAIEPAIEKIQHCSGIDKIRVITKSRDNNLWIGTWGNGLFLFNTQNQTCKNFDQFNTGLDIGAEVISLDEDREGNLWIGTFDRGLIRLDKDRKRAVRINGVSSSSTNFIERINVILEDRNGNIWVGKEAGGVHRVEKDGTSYKAIQTEHIKLFMSCTSIYADNDGYLWLGLPSKGLVRYDVNQNTSKLYAESNGLANSMIYAILGDKQDRIWVSTNSGISMLDKKSEAITNFDKSEGLLASQFNRSSAISTNDGYFAFGSIRGINYFKPELFQRKQSMSKIVFTRLFINNIEQQVGVPGSVLSENLTTLHELELTHKQNFITVEFASLGFTFAGQTEYYYKLTGLNKTWQHSGTLRQVTYTDLKPGNYTLQVTSSPNPEESKAVVAKIVFKIRPAWWQTSMFKFLATIVVILLALGVHRLRINYLLAQKQKLELEVEQRTQKLNVANNMLTSRFEEINSINSLLNKHQQEIIEKNNEIQIQNEELISQNEQIGKQHNKLIEAQAQLREINSNLEKTVEARTETLQHTIDHLNKIVFELDRFVYSASHDLSAPLKSILGLVQIINLEKDPSKVTDYIDHIRATVLKLETVIGSMVDYARNSHARLETESIRVSELMQEVFHELAFLPEASKLIFENHIPADLQVQNDSTRVKMIFNNLLGNSIKYIDRAKDSNWIRLEYSPCDNGALIVITDNGIGIKPEFIDKIFNMYFRATDLSKGSGLGLFIVKETVDKIGGTIRVRSEVGQGTSFEVWIPNIY